MYRPALIPLITCLLIPALLTACGSRRPRLEPPQARLANLEVEPDTRAFVARIRLSNPAARQLTLNAVDLILSVDDKKLTPLKPDFAGDIPALGDELLQVEGTLSPAGIDTLSQLTDGRRSQLPLTISGEVRHSGDQRFEVDDAGWLSPTPGRPWHFR